MVSAFPNNPWFDCECKTHKRRVNDYKRSINIDVEPYKSQYKMLMMEYNRIKQQKSRSFKQAIRNDLLGFESNYPSDYWKLWKSLKRCSLNTSSLINTQQIR